ncbi:MAG TPA: RagB/SusD family nutrient uptake outer membrane protein [Fodinibius sp.]|nr:RagB/SusD family nutrient uptake outer membrane protein [Fodinibius sp.]
MKKLILIILTLLSIVLVLSFCNDLSQNVHSDISEQNFYENERQVLAAAGPAYSNLRTYTEVSGIWGVQEFTSDEMVLPTRGQHWYNDGMYQRYQRHNWHTEEGNTNIAWNDIFSGINTTNRLLHQFQEIEEKSEALQLIIYELRGLRAFWYFLALDMFGNVPLVTSYENADAAPATNSREEVFNFIEEELVSIIPNLSEEVNSNTYGRFHRWAAYTTLAKLYLNAEVYTGSSRYEDALAALNAIIDSGRYSLEEDYFANFAVENQGSSENILVIPYDHTYTTEWGAMHQPHFWTLHFVGNQAVNMQYGAWGGFAGGPEFMRSYNDADERKDIWLTGVQTTPEGDTLYNNQELPSDSALVYTVSISSLENAHENEGARLMKYDYSGAQEYSLDNDYAIYRYADVLLMKAEVLMRQNGGTATNEAVTLVNEVRSRAFENPGQRMYSTASLTMDTLLAERGWEFAGEAWRRNDLVRFDEFASGSWMFKGTVDKTRNIFPIPQQQLNSNPNLEQNPGY